MCYLEGKKATPTRSKEDSLVLWTKLVVPLMFAVFFAQDLGQGDIQTATDLIPNEEEDFRKRKTTPAFKGITRPCSYGVGGSKAGHMFT